MDEKKEEVKATVTEFHRPVSNNTATKATVVFSEPAIERRSEPAVAQKPVSYAATVNTEKVATPVASNTEETIEEAIQNTKKPLAGMDKEQAAKTMMESARVLNTARAIERSKNIQSLKDIIQLLTHYNETKEKLQALPTEVAPREVAEPAYKEIPENTEDFEPVRKHTEYVWLVIFLALATAVFLIGKLGVISSITYVPSLIELPVGPLVITEVDIVFIVLIIVAFVGMKIKSNRNDKQYEEDCKDREKVAEEYKKKVDAITAENEQMLEEYNKEKKDAQFEADNKNSMTKMQRASYQATLTHLESDYMKHYAKMIPPTKLEIDYIKKLVKIIEAEKALNIPEAVKVEASEEDQ